MKPHFIHCFIGFVLSIPSFSLLAQPPLFTRMSSEETGITFVNQVPVYEKMNVLISQYHYNGGGVAIGDLNQDGLQDLFFVRNFGPDQLYLNQGNFQFKEVAKAAGVEGYMSWETGVTLVDINHDGKTDIYVSRSGLASGTSHENLLYINQGNNEAGIPTFRNQAMEIGLFDLSHSTDAAFFDYDRDGDLDVYLLNHNIGRITQYNFADEPILRDDEVGDKLYRNDGGTFTDVSYEAGIIGKKISYGLGVMVGDLNQDGWPDVYVCNDFGERDYLYYNQGDGTFKEDLKNSLAHIPYYSMGGDIADINNDGWLDLMTLDMTAQDNFKQKANMNDMNPEKFWFLAQSGMHFQYMVNCLQLNNGRMSEATKPASVSFSDIAQIAGVAYTDWSWAPLFADFDHDGFKDLFITNGYRVDISNKDYVRWYTEREQQLNQLPLSQRNRAQELQEALSKLTSEKVPNQVYQNREGLQFKEQGKAWGLADSSFSNGVAYGDLDNDGDLDLVVNNLDQEAFLYRNNCIEQERNHFLRIQLKGPEKNPWGIGTKVWLSAGEQQQFQELYVSRGYQSSVEPFLQFGLGKHSQVAELRVEWPDGKVQLLHKISADQTLKLSYQNAQTVEEAQSTPKRLFTDITQQTQLEATHIENEFDDFEREVLLPHQMSRLGPALTVGDVNGDGREDFYLGGAVGYAGKLYLQTAAGTFTVGDSPPWENHSQSEDIDALFFDLDNDGDNDLYVVSGGNEFEENDPLLQDRLYLNQGNGTFVWAPDALPEMQSSGGCVKAADWDQDGDMDLFVGGRQVPGKYPFPGQSYLLKNEGGKFIDVTPQLAPEVAQAGMVTDACWTDYNGDGQIDLIVVGEWMHPMFFKQEKGKWIHETASLSFETNPPQSPNNSLPPSQHPHLPASLPSLTGWWFSISQEDIDGDGDVDYVLGNLGNNYKYQASPEFPFEVYTRDFDENGKFDIVLGYYEDETLFPVRGRQCSSEQIPLIKEKYPTYNTFAEANLLDIYGDLGLDQALHYQARTFSSLILKNEGNGKFTGHALPTRAQIAPINHSIVQDLDNDGHTDILLAGNLYTSEVETPRADGGKGLLLTGTANGEFEVQRPYETGFLAAGDVKQLKAIQLVSGKQGILVAINNGKLKLWEVNP